MKKMGIIPFENKELGFKVRTIVNEDGSISVSAEDTAIGYGWTQTQKKNGKEYMSIRWETINGNCKNLGFPNMLGKDDYIPEELFYLLGFKAGNDRALAYQRWLAMDVLPALRKTGTYTMPQADDKALEREKRAEAMLLNARARQSSLLLKMAEIDTLSATYKSTLVAKAAEVLTGEELLPLPKVERVTYSAEQIGSMLGVSANKVGRVANQHGLKTPEYGEYQRDKSRYSSKEVDTWRYFDTVVPVLEQLLGKEETRQ